MPTCTWVGQGLCHPLRRGAHRGRSRTTSAGRLSSRSPRKRGCRRRPSFVHSAKPIWATSWAGSNACREGWVVRPRTMGPTPPGTAVARRDRGASPRCSRCRPFRHNAVDPPRDTPRAAHQNLSCCQLDRCNRRRRTPAPRRTSASASPSNARDVRRGGTLGNEPLRAGGGTLRQSR